ncbi:hypothetical protein FRB93_010526 [Tulasnella sp. JGI-2019a]|nr:hypothetical protein FRB93_010526 [Tulasnella sp. JGI-2019a]
MDSIVAPDVLFKLSQLLSNLVLGENEIRKNAEKTLNEEWLAKDPGNVLTALALFTRQSPDTHMRSFAAVLLRRLAFRPVPGTSGMPSTTVIYDHLPEGTRKTVESLLLECIANEVDVSVRSKILDTTTELAEGSLKRQRPWPELQAFAAQYALSDNSEHRRIAYQVFSRIPRLLLDQKTEQVVGALEQGLSSETPVSTQQAALEASVAFLMATDRTGRDRASRLLAPMLNTLPPLPPTSLAPFLRTLIPLATNETSLFRPHLPTLVTFLPPLISPRRNQPMTSTSNDSTAPLQGDPPAVDEGVRYAALELMLSLTEGTSKAAQACPGWIEALVNCCLEGMTEIDDDANGDWLDRDPTDEGDEDGYPLIFEEALDRSASALSASILPNTFQHIPTMLAASEWQQRHAALMAICSLAEGTAAFMEKDMSSVINLIIPTFSDPHPRVRTGACHCIGVLCSDLNETLQADFAEPVLTALISTMQAPEARVHSHAASAMINFCSGATKEVITPYLDDIIKALLLMLNSSSKAYVQHQALTTMAMVADCAQVSFRKYYPAIFPIIKVVLGNATRPDQRVLRCRAMECGGLIATAVGKKTFKPDAPEFASLLLRIQDSVTDPSDDTMTYLISTWAKVSQTLKKDFVPYLPFVMPTLLKTASLKPEMSILADDEEPDTTGDWQTVVVHGQRIGIRTAVLEEKSKAFENIVVHCSSLGDAFAEYVRPVLELCLPGLRYFYHEGVRESSAMLIPMLLVCGKTTLTVSDLHTIFRTLLAALDEETESGFLSSLYKSIVDSMLVMPDHTLPADLTVDILSATNRKLQALAQNRNQRSDHIFSQSSEDAEEEKEDMALLEELEDFELDEMSRFLKLLDPNHPLLVAIGSVGELAVIRPQY